MKKQYETGYVIFYPPDLHYNKGLLALNGTIWRTAKEAHDFNRQVGTTGQVIRVKLPMSRWS